MASRIDPSHRRFCEVLLKESIGRRVLGWVSIVELADRLSLAYDAAVVLADDCAKAGVVQHDQSQNAKVARLATELPHSITLAADGWRLLRTERAA